MSNPKSKIVFDARMVHYRRAGGIGQYTISLLRALSALPEVGRDASFRVLQMRGDRARIVRDARFRRVPMWTPPHHRFEQPALGIELLKLHPRPDLIHSPDFIPPRYRSFPAVANIQDLAFLKFPETTLLTDESKRYYGQVYHAAQSADALIAISQSARDDIVSLLGVNADKVAVILAAAGDHFKPPTDMLSAQRLAAQQFGLPQPEQGGYILFVSTIEPRKNLPTLLEAYSLLRDRKRVSPMPVLALAGRMGWLSEEVETRIEALHLREQVLLIGETPAPSLVTLYQGARAFTLPSLYEGFGLPALEALACGVPVIASTGGALPEVVGDAGILRDPHDVEGWAEALERVLLDEGEEKRLREAGPRHAANFSWKRAASETWNLYNKITKREA